MQLNPAIAERLDDEDYPVQDAVDFLQSQLDSGVLEGINEGAVCVVRDALATREDHILELERLIIAADRAMGGHNAPDDCYATGPMTGDPIADLVECPACIYFAMREKTTLTQPKG